VCPKFNEIQFKQKCKGAEQFEEWITVELWDTGNTCLEKCIEFYGLLGSGCCEARHRDIARKNQTAYCRFYPYGQIDHIGNDDVKSVICNGGIFSCETV
jgi:hypothetical protein